MTFIRWDRPIPTPEELRRVHLMGIGGAGMSALARLLESRGLVVSGCDAKESATLAALRALGIQVSVGHHPEHLRDVDTLVISSAIRDTNPELLQARLDRVPVLPRAVALSAAMADKRRIAVAGTHGKTTTTSMLTVALQAAGLDPSYAIGADLNEPGSNAHAGSGEFFVAEADESDRSFLVLHPEVAVVTNVEPDHLDNYGDPEAVHAAFGEFVGSLPDHGVLIGGAEDPGSRRLLTDAARRGLAAVSFGVDDGDLRLEGLTLGAAGSQAEVVFRGRRLGPLHLAVPGRYNAANAAAALATGLHLGLPFADLVRGLAEFRGARRRFEPKGVAGGIRVYDDYAHHPTEVRAVLETARLLAGGGRVIVVFQPHLYSRTAAFAGQFGEALAAADEVVVMDVFAAREDPIPGVTGALIAGAVPLPADRVHYEPSWSAVPRLLAELSRSGDLVLTVGAGDVTMLGRQILDAVAETRRVTETQT